MPTSPPPQVLKPLIWSSLVAKKKPDNVDVDGISTYWWDFISQLNSVPPFFPKHITLQWSRVCATCGIKVLAHASHTAKTCFVCGPDGAHLVDPLPAPPDEWAPLLLDKRLSSVSRKLNNIFCLTALGVNDGDFMKFPTGVSSVTLNGGRTYHRLIPNSEGDHAMRWFIHDPSTFQQTATTLSVPAGWSDIILSGLHITNPFVEALESMHNECSVHTLYLDRPDEITGGDVAAIVAFAPAARPTRRQLVIKGNDGEHIFLDILSPFTEPMHYILLFPRGTLGWDPDRKNAAGKKFSQMRWYRSRIFLNAPHLFRFGRLMGEYIVDAFSRMEEQRLEYIRHNQHGAEDEEDGEFEAPPASGDAEPVADVRLPSSFIHSPAWSASSAKGPLRGPFCPFDSEILN
ncbi:hypothetical protein C8R47DRAFT_1205642 [Mycena vitilis]|nr:hypothetical protein C8R47DRAFT_1205639 [Mycena vitilis]KAJ6517420.1 hypothetical protein C8R47DRAFT_1205642 [Mycena vitilis]